VRVFARVVDRDVNSSEQRIVGAASPGGHAWEAPEIRSRGGPMAAECSWRLFAAASARTDRMGGCRRVRTDTAGEGDSRNGGAHSHRVYLRDS
jgi:hypothetical protein